MRPRAHRARRGAAAERRCPTPRPPSSRTCPTSSRGTCSSTATTSAGADVERVFLRAVPAPRDRRAPVRHRRRAERRSRRRIRATGTWTSATGWARPASSSSTTATCAGRNGASRLQVDAMGNLNRRRSKKRARSRAASCACRWTWTCRRPGRRRWPAAPGAARSPSWTSRPARCSASAREPSFDPNIFSKGIKERDYARLQDEDNGSPLTNRAIQGGYPTGSTFKLITAVAALESGLITPDTPLYDPGSLHRRRHRSSRTPARWPTARSPCARRSPCRATCSSTSWATS